VVFNVFYVPFGRYRSIDWELQFVQIVHGTSTGTTKDIHAIGMHDTDMGVARNGGRPFRHQGRPGTSIKIENVSIRKMPCSIVSTVENHHVLEDRRSGTIASSRAAPGCRYRTPFRKSKVKFVQIRSKGKSNIYVSRPHP
jgi:hypothetical protein